MYEVLFTVTVDYLALSTFVVSTKNNMNKIFIFYTLVSLFACEASDISRGPSMDFIRELTIKELPEKDSLSPEEYIVWIKSTDNGLTTTKNVGGYSYSLQYTPLDYILINEYKEALTEPVAKIERKDRDGLQYFKLQVSTNSGTDILKNNVTSAAEYEQRLNYLAYHMQQDVQLVDQGDTLPCSIYHFERTYGLTPHRTILLGFKASRGDSQDKVLVINDQLTQNGIVKLKIKGDQISKIPPVSL